MTEKRKILCTKPSFEICRLDEIGAEHIEIYSLKEFASQLPETSMDRRGVLGLSVFAGVTAFTAAFASKAFGAEEAVKYAVLPREKARVSTGEIVRIDAEKNIICIKESVDAEELCINIAPETEIEVDKRKKKLDQLRVGERVTVRYTVSFTGERRAISISSPIEVVSVSKPRPTVYSPPRSSGSSCGGYTTRCS